MFFEALSAKVHEGEFDFFSRLNLNRAEVITVSLLNHHNFSSIT